MKNKITSILILLVLSLVLVACDNSNQQTVNDEMFLEIFEELVLPSETSTNLSSIASSSLWEFDEDGFAKLK